MYDDKDLENKVYKVSELQKILKLSRTKAYALCNGNEFPIIKIGGAIRIPAAPFHQWFKNSMRGAKLWPQ